MKKQNKISTYTVTDGMESRDIDATSEIAAVDAYMADSCYLSGARVDLTVDGTTYHRVAA